MKQENHPKEVYTNNKGANQDVDSEILGANSSNGQYIDGRNLRVSSIKSEREAAEKISGEEVIHSNVLPGDYISIAAESVNNNKIEFWVDSNGVEDPVIIIDGVIVAKSPKIPFIVTKPIQHDKNESCVGGEIFVTDFNSPPMIFNLQDMVDSLITNPTKYFLNFNPSLYTINLETPLNIPVFKELVNVGGANGLPIGSYIYSIRYVTVDGDRTDWTPATPPIPVLENLSPAGTSFPYLRTFGGPANIANKTNFGIKIRFRINNTSNFDFLEIRRQSYNLGVSNVLTPDSFIVAKIDLSDGEVSIKDFLDPVDSNVDDAISEEEEVNRLSIVNKAKAIRYHDKRLVLMNVEFESKDTDGITYKDINGVNAVPVVKNLGKSGHKDPFNHTYNKKYMGGEKYGFATVFFGSTGGSSFAKPIPGFENFEFPNRRKAMSVDSKLFSYLGTPTAATTTGTVDKTFEVFDLENAVGKNEACTFKNIFQDGSKTRSTVNQAGCPDPNLGNRVDALEIGYEPLHPVSQNDTDLSGHDYRTIASVRTSLINTVNYNPTGFAPNYYSMGLAVGGVQNIPSWVKGFSVVRTEPAERIVTQGIGMYSMNDGTIAFNNKQSVTSKNLNKLWFHSADANSINSSLFQDVLANPDDFKIQLVSPLGFFSELYNFNDNDLEINHRIIDMVTYARILHDEGNINPNEHPGMGIASGGKQYVAHNKYRNAEAASGGVFSGDGDALIDIDSIVQKTDGDSNYFEIEFKNDIYNTAASSLGGSGDFDNIDMKAWHEPFYIVNIINVGAEVKNLNINSYKGTGHFQKIESIIGIGDGTANQSFELIDERWEDCIPDLSPTGAFITDNRYVYMVDALGISKAWMNVTFRTAIDINIIINDIITNGFHIPEPGVQVFGVYTHTNIKNRDFTIDFTISPFFPTAQDSIVVRYDDRKPLSVFGGDSVVAENVFAPIDRDVQGDVGTTNPTKQFTLNVGFPYRQWQMNERYYIPLGSGASNEIHQGAIAHISRIRQMLIVFAGESKSAINFAHNTVETSKEQYFPLINYVMRPINGTGGTSSLFGTEYVADYGVGELLILFRGGFRFIQQTNVDYSYDGPLQFFSKPQFGFEEVNKFCTAIIWSLPRAINTQDSPGLKTFTSLNRRDIADDQGEIKKSFDATTSGKGENLYAIAESGICLLLTKKAILSNIDSDDLTTTASDEFISGEFWISKEIGSNDEMWRGMGERTIGFSGESGNIEREVLFFPNKQSVYSLVENQIKDIGRNEYYSRLNPYLKGLKAGYDGYLTGVINKNNNEYWLGIENGDIEDIKLFIFGNENNLWEGHFDYLFDKYYMSNDKMFGARDLQTFELEKGFLINGQPIVYELTQAFNPGNAALEKEYIRIGVQTGSRSEMKPTRVEFYDQNMNLLSVLDQPTNGLLYLKQYDGWEQFIGRKNVGASVDRNRIQERVLIAKIIHNETEDFKIVTMTIQHKIIK